MWTTLTVLSWVVLRGWAEAAGLKISPVPVCERVKLNVDIPTTFESKGFCMYACVVAGCINHLDITLIYNSQGVPSER